MTETLTSQVDYSLESPLLRERWTKLQLWTKQRFGKKADMEAILFLVGIQELGHGLPPDLDKTNKEQIVVEGAYCVLETLGYYDRVGIERNGHWIWEPITNLPQDIDKKAEENLLRHAVLRYFDINHKNWIDEL